MATFRTDGLDALELSFEELCELPDDTLEAMLMHGGDVIRNGQKSEIQSMGLVDTGKLHKSITVSSKFKRQSRCVVVYPKGVHHIAGGKKVYNNDIGFVHEFGAPGRNIQPKQWMRAANEKHIDKAVDAEAAVYDEYLKSKGL